VHAARNIAQRGVCMVPSLSLSWLLLGEMVTVEERWQLDDGTMYSCWAKVTEDANPDWLQMLQREGNSSVHN